MEGNWIKNNAFKEELHEDSNYKTYKGLTPLISLKA
jgi:hypothetical protein